MFRRLYLTSTCGAGMRMLSIPSESCQRLTKQLGALKEECKGQGLDLADMTDASRTAMRSLQDVISHVNIEDDQFKGKCTTLSASVKAYTARLSNLQSEARFIQAEVDALLKLIWGTDSPKSASVASPPESTTGSFANKRESNDEFVVEAPPIARALGNDKSPKAEVVEAERVLETTTQKCVEEVRVEEIEVETIEVEVDPQENIADTMKITDITRDLYERGVNFSDCLDARSLRQRYKDVIAGKIKPGIQPGSPKPQETNTNQPRMPSAPQYKQQQQQQQQQQQYQQSHPNTSEAGLTHDPYPNAYRKMVDPMKHVWELKNELAAEKGIDPKSVDLWSGKVKLEDSKKLYDYPSVQSYPIEVRQKGDIPR